MRKKITLGILCLVFILLGIGIYPIKGDKIAKNVYVDDINIGNLTKAQAKEKLSKEYKMQTFNFKYKNDSFSIAPKDIELTYDIDETIDNAYDVNRNGNIIVNIFKSLKSTIGSKTQINVAINCNEDKLEKKLQFIAKDINVEVENATLKVKNNKIEIVKEKNGLELDIKSTKKNFISDLRNGKFSEELVVKNIKPKVSSSDLQEIDTLLGSYTTVLYDASYGRVQNIKLAAQKTSDILLMPGEEFSYNKHTGARNAKNGYKKAHVISQGEVVDAMGGGICQVSSTIFNSVLYAGLDIVSRTNHSIPSDYVDLGRDATVSDTGLDFVFKNNYKNPIFIKTYYSNGTVICQIFGVKSDNKKIKVVTKLNSTIAYNTEQRKNSSLAKGVTRVVQSGRNGYRVTTYRVYYNEKGKKIKTETVCSSYYPSRNSVIEVGTKEEYKSPSREKTPYSNKNNNSGNTNNNSNNNSSNKNPGNQNNNSGNNNSGGDSSGENNQEIPAPEQNPDESI